MTAINEALLLAHTLHQQGRLQDAEQLYREILQMRPGCADAWYFLGVIAQQVGKSELAAEYIRRTLELQPEFAEGYSNLGTILTGQGKLEEAIGNFRRALQIAPNSGVVYFNLGITLRKRGAIDEAIACYRRAAELMPSHSSVHYNLGIALKDRGFPDDAASCYRRAIELGPELADAHVNLGVVLYDQGKLAEAIACYRKALELDPHDANAYSNLGSALHANGRPGDAISCFRKALELVPDSAETLSNLGVVYLEQANYDDALACFRSAIEINPQYAPAHRDRAMLMLLEGDFIRGWDEFEWRWKMPQVPWREFGQPHWEGEPLSGKTILLHAEQGLGDTLQFIRYVSLVKDRGATVIVECPAALRALLKSYSGIDELIACGETVSDCDFHAPLLSLPRICKTSLGTIPNAVPYLFADPALIAMWGEKLVSVRGFRIGINWQGRSGKGLFRLRDVPLDCFGLLAEVTGVQLISLQKCDRGLASTDIYDRLSIFNPGGEIDTAHGAFMDTAAIMMNLDLVITSDTSIAHLAGALGVPVWTVLPFAADWRWLLDRTGSPWYPTMRLFRQKRLGDWSGVFEEIRAALEGRVTASAASAVPSK